MNPVNYSVGQRVVITADNYQTIYNSNRSIHVFPSDSFLRVVRQLMTQKVVGTVSRRFVPGYEFNVTFDNGTVLQMKDHWVTVV
jgi:hypothetical protein